MDDLTLLADSEQQMIAILELLTKYGVTWRLKFADKSEVLVLGVSDPKQEWQLGGQTIKTTSAGKMLGVWYSADGKNPTNTSKPGWRRHGQLGMRPRKWAW